ncbi:hypothetical protein [Schaalia sp. lx-260]|uniref:hypothetical protein n=1 Tax=Schaalia sp. lx-260 TaxID=2899082 RepID=UPI001E613898|nr:hypothetical protein [Schaalia sp. lx-260]MCD4550225.1 hypothetical protein [Schaalia sp. lx-260]
MSHGKIMGNYKQLIWCGIVFLSTIALTACASEVHQSKESAELSAFKPEAVQSESGEAQDFVSYWDKAEHLPPAASDEEYEELFAEAVGKYADCMEGHGWPRPRLDNPHTPFSSLAEDVPPVGQEAAKFKDEKVCLDLAAPWPQKPTLTTEYVSAQYDKLVNFRQCITEHGGTISELPSREKYIADMISGDLSWFPIPELLKSGFWAGKPQSEIYKICPW